jgi:hypothetical protein
LFAPLFFQSIVADGFPDIIAAKEKEFASSFLKMESAIFERIGLKEKS